MNYTELDVREKVHIHHVFTSMVHVVEVSIVSEMATMGRSQGHCGKLSIYAGIFGTFNMATHSKGDTALMRRA